MDFQSLTHPDDLKNELPLYAKLVAGEIHDYVMEKRYIRKSGEIIWVHINGAVVRGNDGKPTQFIAQIQDITARKQAEDELRRFGAIASNSNDLVTLLDKDFIYRAVNSTTLEGFNKTRAEFIGHSVTEVFGKKFFEAVIKPKAEKCFAGEHVQFQAWYDIPAHGHRFLDVAYSPYIDEDGRIEGLVVIGRDMTDRELALEALREGDQKLKNITNAIPGAVFQFLSTKDGDYQFPFMSDGVKQLLEVESSDSVKEFEHFLSYVAPDDLPMLQESIMAVLDNPALWSHRFRITTPSGRVKWLSGKSTPEPRREDGSIVFNGLLYDITERVLAEKALEKAKTHTQQILDAAGEGIYDVDRDGCVTFINPAGARMLGWDRDDIIGLLAHEVLHHTKPDGIPCVPDQCPTYAAIRDGEVREFRDDLFWKKDGTNFPVDCVCTPILENGEIAGAVVVFRDMTEAKLLSEELRYQATHDGLTGLVNRQDFEQRLEHFLTPGSKGGTQNVLAYLDLDQFKLINGTCGHIAGDELLRQLAMMLKDLVRKGDTLARLGGDEFGILMSNCSMPEAQVTMDRVRDGITDFRFVWED